MVILIYFRIRSTGLNSNGVSTTNIVWNRINLPAASHDQSQWGHMGALASSEVLDRMAGGWRCDLDMSSSHFTSKRNLCQFLCHFTGPSHVSTKTVSPSPQEALHFTLDSEHEHRVCHKLSYMYVCELQSSYKNGTMTSLTTKLLLIFIGPESLPYGSTMVK